MPESRKTPSDTLGSAGGKRKERCGKSALRRAIEVWTRGQDKSEGLQNVGELIRKSFLDSPDEEWLAVVNSKNYREVNKRILSGDVENSSRKSAISATQLLYARTAKGRQNLLRKDVEVAPSSVKPSDVYFSGNRCSLPSLQPVVLLDDLNNGSSELAAHSGACILNDHTVATSKPVERRNFFQSTPKNPIPCSSGLPGTAIGVRNGKYCANPLCMKLGRKRVETSLPIKSKTAFVTDCKGGSVEFEGENSDTLQGNGRTSEEIILNDASLSSKGSCGLMQLPNCTMKLDMRARPGSPIQLNRIHRESRIWKEISGVRESGLGSSSKRKASPVKDNCIVKVRRLDEISEESEGDTESSLLEDQSEKCEKIVAGVNKVQSSRNASILNESESARETLENNAESEQETFAGHFRRRMSALENDFQDHLPRNVTDGDSESPKNCNSVASATVSDAPRSVSKVGSVNRQRALFALSPSLQPVVVLRKLTSDDIRRNTPERLRQREEISHNCVEDCESVDSIELSSEEEYLQSFVNRFHRKSYGGSGKGYRKCNCRERKSSNWVVPSSGEKGNGQSSEQESPGCESEVGGCRAVSRLDYTTVVQKGVANRHQNGEFCHRSCNGVREYTFDKITGRSDVQDGDLECGSDEESSNSGVSSAETVEFSTAKTTPPYTVMVSENRKCCSNGMCRVATPELIGLENPITSNRCWMNVTLQTLFSMDNFMQSMIKAFEDVNAEDNSLISCILTLHYARSLGHQECVYEQGRKLAEVLGKLNSDYILNDQQDPSEFILWLFNVFEPALEKYGPSWASSLITENFRFEMEERTCCEGCMNYIVKISSFLILMLDIYIGTSKVRNIQEALAAYTSTKNIRRTCSLCGEEKSMVKTAFKSVPRYLIINLKRYSVKEGEVIRDETPVRHCDTLYLEKYSVPNSTINCSKGTKSVTDASPSEYNIGRKSLRRVAQGDYNLIAIIHHSGFSVSSGHYVCDVYHASTKKWYSYNDKMVKEICEATLSTSKRQKTGYIYVYQNKNC